MKKTSSKRHVFLIINSGKVKKIILSLKKDKVQDLNNNQLKLLVQDAHQKYEKIATSCKPVDESHLINKANLNAKVIKIDGHLSFLEKFTTDINYNSTNAL